MATIYDYEPSVGDLHDNGDCNPTYCGYCAAEDREITPDEECPNGMDCKRPVCFLLHDFPNLLQEFELEEIS